MHLLQKCEKLTKLANKLYVMWYYLVAPGESKRLHPLNLEIDQTGHRNPGNLEQVAYTVVVTCLA